MASFRGGERERFRGLVVSALALLAFRAESEGYCRRHGVRRRRQCSEVGFQAVRSR